MVFTNAEELPRIGDSLLDGIDEKGLSAVEFDDVYTVGEQVNAGSFGVIYEAYHKSNPEETYAVKVMDRFRKKNEKDALHEALILHNLQNVPNVVQLIDLYVNQTTIHMVQAYAKGGDVFDRVIERQYYTEKCAQKLAKILLTTINSIHNRRIVHRDLKPENLLLKDETDDARILLCDFGASKVLPENENYGLLTFVGSPAFMSPEIVNGWEYRESVDVWSVGCIIFMLLSGQFPFGGPDSGDEIWDRILDGDYSFDDEAWDVVSDDAKDLIDNLLNIDPKERCTAAEALQFRWFSQQGLEENNLDKSWSELKAFCARRKLKAAMMAVKLATKSCVASFSSDRIRRLSLAASAERVIERRRSSIMPKHLEGTESTWADDSAASFY